MTTLEEQAQWSDLLVGLGLAVRKTLREATDLDANDWAQPLAQESGDTIYGLDRHVEPVIESVIEQWPAWCKPLVVVAEGMGNNGLLRFGPPGERAKYRVIVDPIDGTRGLMYDKRSAWFLAAVAPELEANTGLSDTFAATIVELPTTKQCAADHFVAAVNIKTTGFRVQVGTSRCQQLPVRPSSAITLLDGFAQVSNFFPGTKVLAADLMERIARRTLGEVRAGRADVFDDQYICTGGQLVELMVGHDRFCCDLRPLFYDILDRVQDAKTPRGIECHPYDLAGMLVAKQSGVILTDGFGEQLDGPMNVYQGMHWCGYANQKLRDVIQPVIIEWLFEHGVSK